MPLMGRGARVKASPTPKTKAMTKMTPPTDDAALGAKHPIAKRRPALWRMGMWGGIVALLLQPAIAMRFTDEVDWTTSDFIFAGVFLSGAALLVELVMRRSRNNAYRAGVCVAVVASLLLVWITGAVGIIGSEAHPANLLYGLVLAVVPVGAVAARFRSGGMAWALAGAAGVQALIGVAALIARWGAPLPLWWQAITFCTGFFVLMWSVSALLFRQASRNL
jgi:hypothetical protein